MSFPTEEVDETIEIDPGPCSRCGHTLEWLDDFKSLQQADLLEKPFKVTEYRAHLHRCPCCSEDFRSVFPAATFGLFGARMTAMAGFLKAKCHASFSAIAEFHRDLLRLPVSRGFLARTIAMASQALAAPWAELRERAKARRLAKRPGSRKLTEDMVQHAHEKLRDSGWSFGACYGSAKRDGKASVCKETRYRDYYARAKPGEDLPPLPRSGRKRHSRLPRVKDGRGRLPKWVDITERPASVECGRNLSRARRTLTLDNWRGGRALR